MVEKFKKSGTQRLLTASLAVIALGVFAAPAASAQGATPLFDALATNAETKLDIDRVQQCLLGAKTMQHASTIDMVKSDSKKAVRATKAAPILEALLRERAQTESHYMTRLAAVKAEYDVFKAGDKDTQKNLFKIAKDTNKACGKSTERMKLKSMGRFRKIGELVPEMSSKTAQLCMAVSSNKLDSTSGILSSLMQSLVWSEVYKKEKRREGFPDDEIIEMPKIKESKAALKEADKDLAMTLFETCGEQYDKASFEYKLTEPDEEPEFVSAIDWD
ncbi:MAG: hypothetical protein ACSHXY_13935 [Alphaproteobacteria bacterium]